MLRFVAWVVFCGLVGLFGCSLAQAQQKPPMIWHTDYGTAVQRAKELKRMLFIFFYESGPNTARDSFLCQTLPRTLKADSQRSERFVWLQLPTSATIAVDGKPTPLLRHASFQHMLNRQGVAIVDYANEKESFYGFVVSQFPFGRGMYYRELALGAILDLPPGTLTQRTLTYAVRTHPDRPRSTNGQWHPVLASEAAQHSNHQANIGVQGHHAWESRFHQINTRLGGGMSAQEVVAESWPGETLVEAAEECVHCWRQSSGHWSAVSRQHRAWAYDMKRGRNGIWYGTGLFGR